MKLLKDVVFALTHPSHWLRNHQTSKELDNWFNEQMDKSVVFKNINEHYAVLNGTCVWISNYPYASFQVSGAIPKRRTVYKLKEWLIVSEVTKNANNK